MLKSMANLPSFTSAFRKIMEKEVEKVFIKKKKEKTKRKYPHIYSSAVTKDLNPQTNYLEFNRIIGNPLNRNLNMPQDMTLYQTDYHNAIQVYHKVIVNKSRKIGATEAVIRSIAMNVFDRYQGHDIMIVAGNELNIAREILLRFEELFHDKLETGYAFKELGKDGNSWRCEELVRRSSIHGQHPIVEFYNDTRVFCFAASKQGKSQSFRGPDDVICIFLSEAAHVGMVEDAPLITALAPNLANRDYADFIMESTPNGKRGFYFAYWEAMMDKLRERYGVVKPGEEMKLLEQLWADKKPPRLLYYPLQWDCHEGIKHGVLSEQYIQDQIEDPEVDHEQEYFCKFTTTQSAALDLSNLQYLRDDDEKPKDLLAEIGVTL